MLTKKQIKLVDELKKPVKEVLNDKDLRHKVMMQESQAILLARGNNNPFSDKGLYIGEHEGKYQLFIIKGHEYRESFIPGAGSDRTPLIRSDLFPREAEEYLATRNITPFKLMGKITKFKYRD